jgi:spore coat protein U-like protein
MKRNLSLLLPATLLLTIPTLSMAAVAPTATLPVTATVVGSCVISTNAGGVNFGNYDPLLATNTQAQGQVMIACVAGVSPTIGLNNGLNGGGTARDMKNGTSLLSYNLYQPTTGAPGAACSATPTVLWGNVTPNLFTPTTFSNNPSAPSSYNICGVVTAGQNVPASATAYSDTVTATVNF